MYNHYFWFLLLFVNFGFIILFYGLFGKMGLYCWIVISVIIANIQVIKTVEIFGFVATLGNIVYGSSFLVTDILNENYGKKAAKKAVYLGFTTIFCVVVLMQLAILFIPHKSDFSQNSLITIFSFMPRIAFASMIAFVLSEFHDVWAYSLLREKSKKIWFANNLSTIISQLIDTLIFVAIAFWGIFELPIIIDIFFTTYVFKLIVALLDSPFLYLSKYIFRKYNLEN